MRLPVHHLGYGKQDRTDRPANLITLCTKCHTSANHKKSGFLYGGNPNRKSFKPATFMSMVRWRLTEQTEAKHPDGYITKSIRIALGIPKSHHNEALVIAGGHCQKRCEATNWEQIRRNNRNLSKFYDAKYIDIRTGEKASGQELSSGRRTRNKNLSGEDLRQSRGHKVSKGRVSVRRRRDPVQPKDIVTFEGEKYLVKGVHHLGNRVILKELNKSVRIDQVTPLEWRKGLCIV